MSDLRPRIAAIPELTVEILDRLRPHYGDIAWWPAEGDWEMMMGAILTQNTSWRNAEKAITALRGAGLLEAQAFHQAIHADTETVAALIRPSRYFNQKAARLGLLADWFASYDFEIGAASRRPGPELRKELLSITGIGPETADCILVYALGKPYFVVDSYTRKLFEALGVAPPKKYEDFQALLAEDLPADPRVLGEAHGLIVEYCKEFHNHLGAGPLEGLQ
ncbi:MAG: hypothetical protein Q4G30_00355 [Actinomycetaceae bacterium]|nr:hypothetical protein [Actinomycetaceae bacterium]